jgi:dihydrofolate reductase
MRKIILSMMLSADGRVARPDGNLDWFRTDADFEDEMLALLDGVDGMFFGRRAYLELAQYWPTADAPDAPAAPGGFTSRERALAFIRRMNELPKLVVSNSLRELPWGPAQLVRGDLRAEVARLAAAPGKDLVVFAGASTAQSFMRLDLIDEYRWMVHPVVLGRGIELFGSLDAERPLELLGSRAFSSGVVLSRYARVRHT